MATILFVDDEEAIRRAVRMWLTRKGHVVQEAADLESARRILTSKRLDGVFIDLWIGTESGLELLGWIEDLDPELAERVAFITGDLFDVELSKIEQRRRVLPKPFELAQVEAMAIAWERRRAAQESEGRDGDATGRASSDRPWSSG